MLDNTIIEDNALVKASSLIEDNNATETAIFNKLFTIRSKLVVCNELYILSQISVMLSNKV